MILLNLILQNHNEILVNEIFENNVFYQINSVRIKSKPEKSARNDRDKNRIKFVITSKNFSKMF